MRLLAKKFIRTQTLTKDDWAWYNTGTHLPSFFQDMPEDIHSEDRKLQYRQLLALAKEAMKFSYAPYSGFRVGAAVLTSDGSVYTGCNIENKNLALGICAERTAFGKAVSAGKRDFKIVAIVAEKAKDVWPCGLCRQVMREFGPEAVVVVETKEGHLSVRTLDQLIPHPVAPC